MNMEMKAMSGLMNLILQVQQMLLEKQMEILILNMNTHSTQ